MRHVTSGYQRIIHISALSKVASVAGAIAGGMAGVWEQVCRDRHCRCAVVTSGCVDEGSSAGIFSLRTLSVVSLLIKLSRSLAVCFVESSLPHRRRLPAMSLLRLCFFEIIFHFRVLYKYTHYIYT